MRKQIQQKTIKDFEKAYDKYADSLFRHSYFRVSDREVALDLVQDSFTKTWNQIAKGEEIKNIKAFLYRVLNNSIIDYYRKKKSESLDNLLDAGFEPASFDEETIVQNSERRNLRDILELLPEKYRDVLILRYIDGLRVSDIALVINETENSVSVRIHRAVKKLQEILEK